MTLTQFIKYLKELEDEGHGDLEVYATHGASGETEPLASPHLERGDPDYVEEDKDFIDVYLGH